MGTMTQDIHDQLTIIAERHLQQVAAIGVVAAALFRMPVLGGDPAGAGRRKAQFCDIAGGTGKDAVAAGKSCIEGGIIDLPARLIEQLGLFNRIGGKAAQAVTQVAPT